jgi:DNA repair exonuclease SbcCD ATPase subunit
VTDEMLEQAKRNLHDELVFFGLTERFDESLVLAKRRLGLRSILYRSSGRVNPARPRGDEIPAELRRAAERCNRYDIELYRYAKELFPEQLEPRDLEFEVELAALRAAKADGELDIPTPPAAFGGDEEAWRMLVGARATAQRLEWERTRHRMPHVPGTVQAEALEQDLRATRAKAARLEAEVERLSEGGELKDLRSTVKKLEREVDALKGARGKAKRLEREVERLRAASSRVDELETEIESLRAAATKTEKLERQLERVNDVRSRNKELQSEVQRLRAASARAAELKREVERLKADASRKSKELEHRIERLKATQSRKRKLEQKVERLRATKGTREPETG